MIKKELLHLPGANLPGSLLLGFLQTLGSCAEILAMTVSIFALGSLWDLPIPGVMRPLVGNLARLTLSLVLLILVKGLSLFLSSRLSTSLATVMEKTLSQDLYLSMFDDRYQGGGGSNQSLAMLSTEGVKRVSSYFTDFLPMLSQAVLMMPITLVVFLPVSPVAAVTILCGMLVMPLVMRVGSKSNSRVQREHLHKYDRVGVHFEESLRGLDTLKIFHADQAQADRLAEESEGFRKQTMAVLGGQLRSLINADTVLHLTVILAAVLTILVHGSQPRLWLLPAILVVTVGSRLFAAEHRLTYLAHAVVVATRQGKAIAALRKAQKEHKEQETGNGTTSDAGGSMSDQHCASDLKHSGIAARGLGFSYADGFMALADLTFDLPERGHIGIVGASGSGKTTLASILSGQLQGYQGGLTLQGREVRNLSRDSRIALLTVVRGGDHLFTGTIRSNLDPAGIGYGEEDLKGVLEDVDLLDLLERPGGLNAPVEQAGVNFSGGQRQRLSIARGLLRRSPIYIFDEATSAVDREHDAALSTLMDELGTQSLVITITHRLAGVRKADRILLLDEGRLAEEGTFEELMAARGLFAAQWEEQEQYEDLEVRK